MFRSAFCLLSVALFSVALQAQTTNPMIAEMKGRYTAVKNNLLKAVEKVPDDVYDFKATPDVRTIGELFMHIAQAQEGTCARVRGEQKTLDFGAKNKADIAKAVKESFDYCDAAWDSVTEANAFEMAGQGRGATTKFGSLTYMTVVHNSEEYGYISVYLRLKGIVPPSSDNAGRGGRGN